MARGVPVVLPTNAETIAYRAAWAGSTDKDIGLLLGTSEATVKRQLRLTLAKARAQRRLDIRTWQMAAAKRGTPALLIWLGKQDLGQKDEMFIGNVNVRELSDEELAQLAAGKLPPRLRLVQGGAGA